jgi:hypothetical protein
VSKLGSNQVSGNPVPDAAVSRVHREQNDLRIGPAVSNVFHDRYLSGIIAKISKAYVIHKANFSNRDSI